ncbi:MAG: protein-methionine-sulfoxide reductase catalytic subunit MsrP [Verrucomicrobiota bacterium]
MANLILRPEWFVPEKRVTPESAFENRRQFLRQLGLAGTGLITLPLLGCSEKESASAIPASSPPTANAKLYPAARNPDFNPKGSLTNEKVAGSYNNFYEFSLSKDKVRELVGSFVTAPWPIEIGGLVEKPIRIDAEELTRLAPLEERVYRFRCVEAWAMVVPWTGFPLSKLIAKIAPKTEAKFIRFETASRPSQMPGMSKLPNYPWPYFEGLRMDEAMHPLTMVVTGIYGKPLAKQHGAPLRIVVPWKYGYKSIKSVVKIDFVEKQPTTFWETLGPDEYPFESNVNPAIPHPRWSQAIERIIDTGDSVKTQPYNGYGKEVASLYTKI